MITKVLAGNSTVIAGPANGTGTVRVAEGPQLGPLIGPQIGSQIGPQIVGKDNSPFQTVLNKGRFDLARVMLLAYRDYSPVILADLNWRVRRVAFLITFFGTPLLFEVEDYREEVEDGEEGLVVNTLGTSMMSFKEAERDGGKDGGKDGERGGGKDGWREGGKDGGKDGGRDGERNGERNIYNSNNSCRSRSLNYPTQIGLNGLSVPGGQSTRDSKSSSALVINTTNTLNNGNNGNNGNRNNGNNGATFTEGYLRHNRESLQKISSSSTGRLSPVLTRPTPYARMMSSFSHLSDRDSREGRESRERFLDRERDWLPSRTDSSDSTSPRLQLNVLHGLYRVNMDIWRLVITFL